MTQVKLDHTFICLHPLTIDDFGSPYTITLAVTELVNFSTVVCSHWQHGVREISWSVLIKKKSAVTFNLNQCAVVA